MATQVLRNTEAEDKLQEIMGHIKNGDNFLLSGGAALYKIASRFYFILTINMNSFREYILNHQNKFYRRILNFGNPQISPKKG